MKRQTRDGWTDVVCGSGFSAFGSSRESVFRTGSFGFVLIFLSFFLVADSWLRESEAELQPDRRVEVDRGLK